VPQNRAQRQWRYAFFPSKESKTKIYKKMSKFEFSLLIMFGMPIGMLQQGFQGFLFIFTP